MRPIKVLLNCAVSSDGFLGRKGRETKLSNDEDWKQVHLLREAYDVILVGAETLRIDDPSLLVKQEWIGKKPRKHPHRAVLTISGNIPIKARVLDSNAPTTLFSSPKGVKVLQEKGVLNQAEIVTINPDNAVEEILGWMEDKGYHSLFVEGGSKIFSLFLRSGINLRLRVFRSPLILGGTNSVPLAFETIVDLKRIRTYLLGNGTVDIYEK